MKIFVIPHGIILTSSSTQGGFTYGIIHGWKIDCMEGSLHTVMRIYLTSRIMIEDSSKSSNGCVTNKLSSTGMKNVSGDSRNLDNSPVKKPKTTLEDDSLEQFKAEHAHKAVFLSKRYKDYYKKFSKFEKKYFVQGKDVNDQHNQIALETPCDLVKIGIIPRKFSPLTPNVPLKCAYIFTSGHIKDYNGLIADALQQWCCGVIGCLFGISKIHFMNYPECSYANQLKFASRIVPPVIEVIRKFNHVPIGVLKRDYKALFIEGLSGDVLDLVHNICNHKTMVLSYYPEMEGGYGFSISTTFHDAYNDYKNEQIGDSYRYRVNRFFGRDL